MAQPLKGSNSFETDLDKNSANYEPLTPLSFLQRTAWVYSNRLAVVHGNGAPLGFNGSLVRNLLRLLPLARCLMMTTG